MADFIEKLNALSALTESISNSRNGYYYTDFNSAEMSIVLVHADTNKGVKVTISDLETNSAVQL